MTDDRLSTTMCDYLVNIYRLAESKPNEDYVGTSELADQLAVSAPAVNRMVTKLRALGLLHHERYQGIALTDDGKRAALKQLRRHRIVETFLVEVMGFGWHEVAHEAERMGSELGEKLLTRMSEMAGNPTHGPHGDPIPGPDGELPPVEDRPLAVATPEQDYRVTRITTHEADRLEYIAALGLKPGETFRLLHAAPFNGPLQLQLGREYRIIGFNLAEIIHVQPLSATDNA
jgi:DtxR family transcriptional regulator, Mn-dependent transcriptional regulator